MNQSIADNDLDSLIARAFPKKATLVLEELASKHGITTKEGLLQVSSAERIQRWRLRIGNVLSSDAGQSQAEPWALASTLLQPADLLSSERNFGGVVQLGWQPREGLTLLVMQGDLTTCKTDAVVNAANSQLAHGGGLAAAIVRKGGFSIQKESDKWIQKNHTLEVGAAMSTTAGKLPCKRIIHSVGPKIGRKRGPTDEEASQLRQAAWSALAECDRLGLTSIAIPGISTGSFHYPADLGAAEIVSECIRFCSLQPTTSIRTIAFMNIDEPTVSCFAKALEDVAYGEETARRSQEIQQPERLAALLTAETETEAAGSGSRS